MFSVLPNGIFIPILGAVLVFVASGLSLKHLAPRMVKGMYVSTSNWEVTGATLLVLGSYQILLICVQAIVDVVPALRGLLAAHPFLTSNIIAVFLTSMAVSITSKLAPGMLAVPGIWKSLAVGAMLVIVQFVTTVLYSLLVIAAIR